MTKDWKIKIDKFDCYDFGFYKIQIEDYLYQKKLQEPLAEAKPIGESVADHVNDFYLILAHLVSVDIKVDDAVHALLLLSSLLESWSGTVIIVSVHKIEAGVGSKIEGRSSRTDYLKPLALKDKEINMTVGDSDDAFVCCVENTIEDRIMDFGASFHATYCKEELEGLKLRSGSRGDAGLSVEERALLFMELEREFEEETFELLTGYVIRDVVLKTSFGTSWTLEDVYYIPDLKRRLISIGQLDEKVTTWKVVVENETNHQVKCLKSDNDGWYTSSDFIEYYDENEIKMLKMISETPQQNGVDETMNKTLNERAKSMRLHAGLLKCYERIQLIQ
nr:retrovirus-related Pol polyprotein from transposon TNT 1-94 [Tanacetum cinerariifolium]